MIPKIIHYCWFGGNPLPELAQKCIASWRKYLPDYDIKEWNEDNFDVNIISYTSEAYEAKKYAFVSDYARFWILYKYGGLYFDTDVEVIKPLDDIIEKGSFMGCENEIEKNGATTLGVAPGLGLGVNPGLGLYKDLLDLYETLSFKTNKGNNNLKTVVEYTSELLYKRGMKNINEIQIIDSVFIYPKEYFCPKRAHQLKITVNSRTIHHYSGSWLPLGARIKIRISKILGPFISRSIIYVKQRIKRIFKVII
ncbi:MAG: glycosyltransferase [Peptostreptococcaceae bacterium]